MASAIWAAPTAASAQRLVCRPGMKLEALYQARWYAVTVKQGPDPAGRCFIGYDGWDAKWDEWVVTARLRPLPGAATAGMYADPRTPSTGVTGGALADGRYICQIWIGSMLSTLGKVDISGRSYRGPSHNPSGGFTPFTVVGGRMDWRPNFSQLAASGAHITGTKVNAGGRSFSVNYVTGRGYNESMECTRE